MIPDAQRLQGSWRLMRGLHPLLTLTHEFIERMDGIRDGIPGKEQTKGDVARHSAHDAQRTRTRSNTLTYGMAHYLAIVVADGADPAGGQAQWRTGCIG